MCTGADIHLQHNYTLRCCLCTHTQQIRPLLHCDEPFLHRVNTHTHTNTGSNVLHTGWILLKMVLPHSHTNTLLLWKTHDLVFRECGVKNACSTLWQGVLVCVCGCVCVCVVPWPDSGVKGNLTVPEKILRHTHRLNTSPKHARTILSLHSNLRQNWWAKSSWLYVRGEKGGLWCLKCACVCWVVCDFEKEDKLVHYFLRGD